MAAARGSPSMEPKLPCPSTSRGSHVKSWAIPRPWYRSRSRNLRGGWVLAHRGPNQLGSTSSLWLCYGKAIPVPAWRTGPAAEPAWGGRSRHRKGPARSITLVA
jgi:hypothetical protein